MEYLKKYPKLFQWLFLLAIFFGLCFAIDVPETYKFIRGQAEFIKDPNQSVYFFLGKKLGITHSMYFGDCHHYLVGCQFG